MLSWLRRRSERARRIDAEANALVHQYGKRAYSIARRREQEASSLSMTQEWNRIALAVARKAQRQVSLDTGTRMAMDADLGFGQANSETPPFFDARSQLDELEHILRQG
jgi:hypothetical protein